MAAAGRISDHERKFAKARKPENTNPTLSANFETPYVNLASSMVDKPSRFNARPGVTKIVKGVA